MINNSMIKKFEYTSWILLCIIMIDCSIFGAGRVIMIGSLSFRMIIFGLLFCCSLPLVFKNIRFLLKNIYIKILISLAIWTGVSLIIGVINNNDIEIIISDIKGLLYFTVLPGIIYILRKYEKRVLLTKIIMYSAFVLALIVIVHLLISIFFHDNIHDIAIAELEDSFSMISVISFDMPRIFMFSEMYLVAGCAFAIYYQIVDNGKQVCFKYVVITGVCLFALLVSYTRAVYLGTAVTAIVTIAITIYYYKEARVKLFKYVLLVTVLVAMLVSVFFVITGCNYFSYALSRSFSIEIEKLDENANEFNKETALSDNLREETANELAEKIKEHPFVGNGLGVGLECRNGGTSEYFFLEFWSKCGIIGLLLYLLPFFMMVRDTFKWKRCKNNLLLSGVWIAALMGFMSFSYFNPYMNAALGILFYCCAIGVNNLEHSLSEQRIKA